MRLPFRPLGVVKELIEQMGADLTYAYEDLIFISHNHFLLQFGPSGEQLYFWTNVEATAIEAQQAFDRLKALAADQGLILSRKGRYTLAQGDGENLNLQFHVQAEGEGAPGVEG